VVYHVICRGNNRQAIFRDEQDRIGYLEKLSFYCQGNLSIFFSYCLLANHVHLLLESPQGNLSKMLPRRAADVHPVAISAA
jgi:putative transposase